MRRILNSYVEIRLVPICTRKHDQIVEKKHNIITLHTLHKYLERETTYHTIMKSSSSSNGGRKRARSISSTSSLFSPTNQHQRTAHVHHNAAAITSSSSSNRLLRLNVGGHPYDVIRTSLPLLETMMTDRWLDSCLLDSDGRIFLDRDGNAFGDILRYLRGGADFLLELLKYNNDNANCCAYTSAASATDSYADTYLSTPY